MSHLSHRPSVDIFRREDHEIGDGTTGVVVMAGALLEKAAWKHLIRGELGPLCRGKRDGFLDGYEI